MTVKDLISDLASLDPNKEIMVLDGPNGNGRSLAFALLADRLLIPAWLVVDDYDHYPFLEDLGRLFEFSVIARLDTPLKRSVLIKIVSRRVPEGRR